VKREYRSTLRDAHARLTRRNIVETAARLFVTQGYAPTTIEAVAREAGVSRKTVFAAVGGKAQLLKYAWEWSLVGDDEPVPMLERPSRRSRPRPAPRMPCTCGSQWFSP
jgi:AcrR family transcriptional regulator